MYGLAGDVFAARNADCSEHGSARISRRVEEIRARAHYVKRPSGRVYGVTLLSARDDDDDDDDSTHARYRYANATQIPRARGGSRETVHTGCRALSRDSDSEAIFPSRPCLESLRASKVPINRE